MNRLLKPYEREAERAERLGDGILRLAWIDVLLDESELLYRADEFTPERFARDFQVRGGSWRVRDGWLVGENPDSCPGMAISRADYFGNIYLEARVATVAPSTHDINFMINGSWDEAKNERGAAYVAGLEAFWHGSIGFERSPDYTLTAATPLFDFVPGREYVFGLGNADGRLFVTVDGRTALEVADPAPLDAGKLGKIGFEAFSSCWKLRDVRVRRLALRRVREYYNPER